MNTRNVCKQACKLFAKRGLAEGFNSSGAWMGRKWCKSRNKDRQKKPQLTQKSRKELRSNVTKYGKEWNKFRVSNHLKQ